MQKPANQRNGAAPARRNAPARPSAAPRNAAPARRKPAGSSGVNTNAIIIAAVCVLALVGAYFMQYKLFPNGMKVSNAVNEVVLIDAANTVRMTEVMSSNSSVIQDDKGMYSDWIEITNVSGGDVNLKGWKIAKDASLMLKYFEFPNHTLKSGERVIVYCTSTTANVYGYGYHAPFKISAAGDTLILYNASDVAVQSLNVPEMSANQSYAEMDGVWQVTDLYTPLMANTEANHNMITDTRTVYESPIELTEMMAKNVTYAPDENGEYLDWIEIHNTSAYAVSLDGYGLTDSLDSLQKWRFPNVSLGPGEYMIVYASGYDRREPGSNLHTNFRLSTEKEGAILTNATGQIIDIALYDLLKADQSYAKQADGSWTTNLAPTPGMANTPASAALIDDQFAAQNTTGVYLSEIMASTSSANSGKSSYDWLEIKNTAGYAIDLSGWGLSDDPSKPRKWQFPEGTVIQAGQYAGVLLSGNDTYAGGYYHTNFRLSSTEGETVVLSAPDGTILDRAPLGTQYSNISYGRITGQSGWYYLNNPTALASNNTTGVSARALAPSFSQNGGLYAAGTAITLTLSAEPDATIYYTLDSSEPNANATRGGTFEVDPRITEIDGSYITYVYSQPIEISATTVVRAKAVKNGCMDSAIQTQTYFVGVSHTMQVVSLVTDPVNLWDYNNGIYVKGPNALAESPYGSLNKGANFWMDWEKAANVEIYGVDGETILSQACGIKLHGQYSRKEAQKAFKVVARTQYGSNRFYAKLFPNRDYTEYQSFLLRSSGQDTLKTRMRDSILQELTAGSSVMYQDTALAIVYINGYYWGQYNLRERINTYSICQWEGWDPAKKDDIDLIKANTSLMQGDLTAWTSIRDWVKSNGAETAAKLEYINKYIDVQNYLEYVAVQMFTGNTDLLNCKKYRLASEDGRWRWILFDMDWAFITDTDSVSRWLAPGGMGSGNKTDNSLFVALMKNAECRDWFLSYFSEKLATTWSTENVKALIMERYNLMLPELSQHLSRWNLTESKFNSEMKSFVSYAETRPGRLLFFFSENLSDSDMQHYFGDILKTVTPISKNL